MKTYFNTLWRALFAACAVLTTMSAPAANDQTWLCPDKNAFAYDVVLTHANNSVTVTYKLSAQSQGVTVDVLADGMVVKTVAGGTAWSNTVTVPGIYGPGDITARVNVTSKEHTAPYLIMEHADDNGVTVSNGHIPFCYPTSVTVNNCTDSPLFGTVLVSESWTESNTTGQYYSCGTQSNGRGFSFYAFDPKMRGIANPSLAGQTQSHFGFTGNLTYNGTGTNKICGRFYRMRFSEDGRLFSADVEDDGGVWEYTVSDVNHFNSQARKVITGVRGAGLDTWGKGADLKIGCSWATKFDNAAGRASIGVCNLGTATSWTGPASHSIWDDEEVKKMQNLECAHMLFDKDGRGLIAHTHGQGSLASPTLIKFEENETGTGMTRKWTDHNVYSWWSMAAVYNKDRSLLAVSIPTHNKYVQLVIFSVDWDNPDTVDGHLVRPKLTELGRIAPDVNNINEQVSDMAFDYANNLYAVSTGSKGFACFGLPTAWSGQVHSTPSRKAHTYYEQEAAASPSYTPAIINDGEQVTAAAIDVAWGQPAYNTEVFDLDHYLVRLTQNNLVLYDGIVSPTAPLQQLIIATDMQQPLQVDQAYAMRVLPYFKRKADNEVRTYTRATPTTVTPTYAAGIGLLSVKNFEGHDNMGKAFWRVDIDFDRASLADYPQPVSYFTVERALVGTDDYEEIPNLRMRYQGQNWVTEAEHNDFKYDPVFNGTIPGQYDFAADKQYALAPQPHEDEAVPVVAYHYTYADPTKYQYRAKAVYGAQNSAVTKMAASNAAVPGKAVSTGIADLLAPDDDTPSVYYNMQGVRIDAPVPGQPAIELQGTQARKIIR